MKKILIFVFLALMAAQMAVPASMIASREDTIKNGKLFKFKTAPVDPYDAFRGKYVALSFEENWRSLAIGNAQKQNVYLTIGVDGNGYAKILGFGEERPVEGDYIKAPIKNGYARLPFDRYYLGEHTAPQAEQIYWRNNSRFNPAVAKTESYVTVRVKDGNAVIEGLYINGERIEKMVKGIK